jgi:hypothetical protein
LVLGRQVDLLEELWGDGETAGSAESTESGIFIVMVMVEVVATSVPGAVDRVTTGVVLLYIWGVAARHGRRVVTGSGAVVELRQFGGIVKVGGSRINNDAKLVGTQGRTGNTGNWKAAREAAHSTGWDESGVRLYI